MDKPQYPIGYYVPSRPSTERPAGAWGRFRFDHCYTLDNLVKASDDFSQLTARNGGNTCHLYKCRNKHQLAKKITLDFVELLLDELIRTGEHYRFPVGNSRLRVVAFPLHINQKLLRQGRYRMNDVRATGGRFYTLKMEMNFGLSEKKFRSKSVYVDMTRYHRLCYLVATKQVVYDSN